MNWEKLMSRTRIRADGSPLRYEDTHPARSEFQRDWDRILFSSAFRRLHNKTQVFPMPVDDFVHSRLTHSLEVASVGRSLGARIGLYLKETGQCKDHFDPTDVAHVVAAACLAHDIGNPPFGHAGEKAIARFFDGPQGKTAIGRLDRGQQADFTKFEGNAQGFRILTATAHTVGLELTAATLGAFSKYPCDSTYAGSTGAAYRKNGCFQRDAHILKEAANFLELKAIDEHTSNSWKRHPLAYLVEAADDICYSILDLEDGYRLHLVEFEELQHELMSIVGPRRNAKKIAQTEKKGRAILIGYLRALAIGQFIDECAATFIRNEPDITAGRYTSSITDDIESRDNLKKLKELAKKRCYKSTGVLEIELAGFKALGGLLEIFIESLSSNRGAYEDAVASLLENFRIAKCGNEYENILRITDYISGMTDRFALSTYRRLTGISLPG